MASCLVSTIWLNILGTTRTTWSADTEASDITAQRLSKGARDVAKQREYHWGCDIYYLATVSKEWITFSPVAALHSMNSKLYSCGRKTSAFSDATKEKPIFEYILLTWKCEIQTSARTSPSWVLTCRSPQSLLFPRSIMVTSSAAPSCKNVWLSIVFLSYSIKGGKLSSGNLLLSVKCKFCKYL